MRMCIKDVYFLVYALIIVNFIGSIQYMHQIKAIIKFLGKNYANHNNSKQHRLRV